MAHRIDIFSNSSACGYGVFLLALALFALLFYANFSWAKPAIPPSTPDSALQTAQAAENHVLKFTNAHRREHGLRPLEPAKSLRAVARRHSEHMCSTRAFQHESDSFPKGWRKFPERLKAAGVGAGAENIGYRTWDPDTEKWAAEVVHGWMKSKNHKKNILNPRYRYLGVGILRCRNNLGYATQVFSPEPGRSR
ncbi:MAG: CAP domain-containing protein [Thermodesulfobacteriota bacterium]